MQQSSQGYSPSKLQTENPWLLCSEPRSSARLRLVCFPYAGGNAGVFRNWASQLNEEIELVAVQYPGRATRFKEPLISSMHELVDGLFNACVDYFDEKPMVFFGHSMGASVAWELCRKLQEAGASLPRLLIVSGRRAPGESLPADYKMIHDLPKKQFLERLLTLNGTPQELLEHEDLMELMEPIIRNDFKLIETWSPQKREAMELAIEVLGGEDDSHLNRESLEAWKEETSETCNTTLFPGDHFYLHQHEQALIQKLNTLLANI